MSPSPTRPSLDTLEPLIDAVVRGVEDSGWRLSGMQKTTSLQFEGRWEGDETRSAFLFFHRLSGWDAASIDVYLDESSGGLKGNLALVVEGPALGRSGAVTSVMEALVRAAAERLPGGFRTPVTLRFRLPDRKADPREARSEIRFKLEIPGTALEAGASAVSAVAATAVEAFEALVGHPRLSPYVSVE